MLTIPFLLKNCYHFYNGHKTEGDLLFDSYLLSLCVFVALTNEFHKVRFAGYFSQYRSYLDFPWLPRPLWQLGQIAAKYMAHSSTRSSPPTSRPAPFDLLLHHDRVAWRAAWGRWLLAATWAASYVCNWRRSAFRWCEVDKVDGGTMTLICINFPLPYCTLHFTTLIPVPKVQ